MARPGSLDRPRMTRTQIVGLSGLVTVLAVTAVGLVAGLLVDRLLDFDDALDAGGEWDEGGGTRTPWD